MKKTCLGRPESGHLVSGSGYGQPWRLKPQVGMTGESGGEVDIMFTPSLPPRQLSAQPQLSGVAAWTKAPWGCQLVPWPLHSEVLFPDQRHIDTSLHPGLCEPAPCWFHSSEAAAEVLTLPRPTHSEEQGKSEQHPPPRTSRNLGEVLAKHPHASRGEHAHPSFWGCPHLHTLASHLFQHQAKSADRKP